MTPQCMRPPVLLCQEVLIDVAPKKANWDLRRDIAGKLTKLERRTQVRTCAAGTNSRPLNMQRHCHQQTPDPHVLGDSALSPPQAAMIKLMQQEEARRQQEEQAAE